MPYTKDDVATLTELLKQRLGDKFYYRVSYSDLGGAERASLMINTCIDKKEEWPYGIYLNSRRVLFAMHSDSKLEIIAKLHTMPKMRKCKIKSLEDAADKISNYLNNANNK
jgi:hypothetical protein